MGPEMIYQDFSEWSTKSVELKNNIYNTSHKIFDLRFNFIYRKTIDSKTMGPITYLSYIF